MSNQCTSNQCMNSQNGPSPMNCEDKRKDDKKIDSRVENCGRCCLIHQQFTLTENITVTEPGLIVVYNAPDFLFGNGSPFGTVIVSNCGCTPLQLRIVTATSTISPIVPPKGQYALTGSIREIDVGPTTTARPIPICAVFSFDLFLILPQCSAPDDDADITIDNNIGSASSSSSSSFAASASSVNGNNSITGTVTATS